MPHRPRYGGVWGAFRDRGRYGHGATLRRPQKARMGRLGGNRLSLSIGGLRWTVTGAHAFGIAHNPQSRSNVRVPVTVHRVRGRCISSRFVNAGQQNMFYLAHLTLSDDMNVRDGASFYGSSLKRNRAAETILFSRIQDIYIYICRPRGVYSFLPFLSGRRITNGIH